jgi:putative sterol carrier protein
MNATEIFAQMPEAFRADKAGICTVVEGKIDKPDVTVGMLADDYVKITTGELQPVVAFMQGRLKLQGDMNLAMKLQELFNR